MIAVNRVAMITKIGGIRASSYSMLVLMAIVTIFTLNYDFASAGENVKLPPPV